MDGSLRGFVHHGAYFEGVRPLTDNISQRYAGQELPDFVQNRPNGGGPAPSGIFVVFGELEGSDLWMFNFQQDGFVEITVS